MLWCDIAVLYSYHPHTSGQVEVTNRGLKGILERTVGVSRKDWALKLDYTLWEFRTAYRTSIGFMPYKLVYGKSCHLRVELEHRTLWALKTCNFDVDSIRKLRSRWSGPFVVKQVFLYGTVELHHPEKGDFKVNGHRLKLYHGNSLEIEQRVDMVLYLHG
ncbi:uncharacterized protein LOC125369849 [Ricinus communis]|uniref:uncharacterized protein LOC125369849 n=1 Tax=Ricinus communis TaxID=3988 RepID=UPI00201B2B1F|nr:uncharacterized protein LOC125369849 [Ricinus communis]